MPCVCWSICRVSYCALLYESYILSFSCIYAINTQSLLLTVKVNFDEFKNSAASDIEGHVQNNAYRKTKIVTFPFFYVEIIKIISL